MQTPKLGQLIQTFLISRQAAGLSDWSVTFYRQQLGYFLNWLGTDRNTLADLNVDTITLYLAERQTQVKPRSVHCAWRAIRAWLNWLEKRKYPDWTNPVAMIVPPRMPRDKLPPVSRETVRAMLAMCRAATFLDRRDNAIIRFLASSGCRSAEFLALVVGDVDLQTGAVMVLRGKGGKRRMTIIDPQCRLAVAGWLEYHRTPDNPNSFLWLSYRHRPLSACGLAKMLQKRARLANVKAPSIHSFRRRWASDLVPRLGPYVVQALGGWADLSIVTTYVTLSANDLLEAYNGMQGHT